MDELASTSGMLWTPSGCMGLVWDDHYGCLGFGMFFQFGNPARNYFGNMVDTPTCCRKRKLYDNHQWIRWNYRHGIYLNREMNSKNCTCLSCKYTPKAKWKFRVRLGKTELTMLSLLWLSLFTSSTFGLSDYESCLLGEQRKGYALSHMNHEQLGYTRSFKKCVRMCCAEVNCNMALLYNRRCYKITCKPNKKCKPVHLPRKKIWLFMSHRNSRRETSEGENNSGVSVNREKASCRPYFGKTCSLYLDKSKFYYFPTKSGSSYDDSIADAFTTLESYLSVTCLNFALSTACYQWYPQCLDPKHPRPTSICRKDCLMMKNTVCKQEYSLADADTSLSSLLPDCEKLNDNAGCLRLTNLPGTLNDKSSSAKANQKRRAEADLHTEDMSSTESTIPTTATLTIARLSSAQPTTVSLSTKRNRRKSTKHTTIAITTGMTTKKPSLSTKRHHGHQSQKGNVSNAMTPTIVKVTDSSEGTELSEKENTAVPTSQALIPTTSPISSIKVSAGENKVITLPENKVSLYASTWPKPAEGVAYKYKWIQVAAPEKSQGYMEGKDTSRLTLTMLDVPGIYQFKVSVSSKLAKGEGYVNVTVKPVPRVNRPPRADIQPREQSVTLPVKSVVLSGSKSTDDDKIVSYKWEEVKGPIADHGKIVMVGDDKEVLQIKNLAPGVYTFRLTVVDSDGEQDNTDATVTVKEEKDYPPVARAGDGVILTLPDNQVTLYGNGSTDDKKIVKYEWTKSPDSPTTGDMLGTNKAILKVSNLVVGHYTFVLHVTDSAGQTSDGKVTVVVQPEKNSAPVAVAGPDKDLVYPDDSTTLDASKSSDDQHHLKFHWQQVSGPDGVVLSDISKAKLQLSGLKEGHYTFKVTVTDEKGLSASDTVSVNVKKDVNEPPVARAGPDITVILPNRAAVLDGSKSTDDQLITSYEWTRDGKSPAAGDVINNSNHQPILRLTNLVEGTYTFTLVATDNKGLKGSDNAIVAVRQDESTMYLVELYLEVDITQFTEESKKQLLRKLSVILNVDDGNVVMQELRRAAYGTGLMIVFYVITQNSDRKMDGQVVANILKQKVGYHGTLFEYKMLKVEPFVCRNNCSGHGYCDKNTKQCVCDGFWMQDVFKSLFGARESNCDWSILYVTVIAFGIIVAVIALTWAFCFLYARRRKARRRLRYIPVNNDDDDTKDEIMMIPKGKYFTHSLTFTESDDDSEEETTVFDKKVMVNGSTYPNGSVNGLVPRKSHAT